MLVAVFHSIAGKTFTSSKWQVLWLHTHYCRMVLQYVYQFLVSGEKEHAAAYVDFDDLPKTAKTEILIEFLHGVSKSSNGAHFNKFFIFLPSQIL